MTEAFPTSPEPTAFSPGDRLKGVSATSPEEYVDAELDSVDEHEAIASRYQDQLRLRGHRSPFSPDFLNSRPRSALEKYHITAETEEQVLYLYAATYSIHQTASASGVSLDKVRAIVYSPTASPRIQGYRDEMKVSLLQKIEETQVVLLDTLQDPSKLADATLTQISEVFTEISETQTHLLSSLRESAGTASTINPLEAFDGEDLEYIALLRKRLAIGQSAKEPQEDLYFYENGRGALEAHFTEGESENLDPPDIISHDDPAEQLLDVDLHASDDPAPNGTIDIEPL